MKVSVLLLTFNEAQNLEGCLKALKWCDDIVVVDSGSTDETVSIAQAFGARVLTRPFDNFAAQRNFGIENGQLQNEWILHLDADEIVTPEFKSGLDKLTPPEAIAAYRVPSKTMLRGRWIKHAGMYPSYQVRLGRRNDLRFKQVGHGQREDLMPSQVGTFDIPYLHHNFSHGFSAWLRKHVRYAEDEAKQILAERTMAAERSGAMFADSTSRRRWLKRQLNRSPLFARPGLRFCYIYFWRLGLLDGANGFLYAFMLSVYEAMIVIIYLDLKYKNKKTNPQ